MKSSAASGTSTPKASAPKATNSKATNSKATNSKATNSKSSSKKSAPATTASTKAPAAKSETKPETRSETRSAPAKVTKGPAASKESKSAASAKQQKPVATSKKPEPAKPAPEPAKDAAKAKGKSAPAKTVKTPAKSTGETGASDMPNVPKKGPIDTAHHKSVAVVAAAIANARGDDGSGYIMVNGRRVRAISTKGIVLPKKSKSSAAEAAPAPTDQQIASIKTKLSKKELDDYRTLLLAKRKQLVGMLNGMEDEALRSSGGNLSNMPVHMADMGSDVYDQDFTLGMAETERAILDEIDAALQRIADRTFGVCQMTGKPISKARLDAKPWAKYSIEAERIAEANGSR